MKPVSPLLFCITLLVSSPGLASDEFLSVTVKPATGIAGTTSLNLHPEGICTLLQYESSSSISEEPVELSDEKRTGIRALAHEILKEIVSSTDYSAWPEKDETLSISITVDRVTKSVSTRRFSEKASTMRSLLDELQE